MYMPVTPRVHALQAAEASELSLVIAQLQRHHHSRLVSLVLIALDFSNEARSSFFTS